MKTRQEAHAAAQALRKDLERAARLIDEGRALADPETNAELMRSLHRAQDALARAGKAITAAKAAALSIGSRLASLLPDELAKEAAA